MESLCEGYRMKINPVLKSERISREESIKGREKRERKLKTKYRKYSGRKKMIHLAKNIFFCLARRGGMDFSQEREKSVSSLVSSYLLFL